jgi:hypothetical protein
MISSLCLSMISGQTRSAFVPRENRFPLFRIMLYSQAHTSMTLAAQAASSATVSVRCTRSQEVCSVDPMLAIFRRFYSESPADSFFPDSGLVKDSGTPPKGAKRRISPPLAGELRDARKAQIPGNSMR